MNKKMMPNFFVLGAAKSGTTTLYSHLSTHSNVYFPIVKEPNFFSNDAHYERGLEYYCNRFFGENASDFDWRGEATTNYMCFDKVAKRINYNYKFSTPKFIIIMRNPIYRAYSLYWHSVRDNKENLPFEKALDKEQERINRFEYKSEGKIYYSYANSGLYAKQIKTYLNYFDRGNFLFLFTKDLRADPKKVLKKVADFLDIKFDFKIKDKRKNSSGMPRFPLLLALQRKIIKTLQNNVPEDIKKLFPRDLFYSFRRKLYNLNIKEFDYPPMSETVKNRLKNYFKSDILELEKITGRELNHWLEI